MVINSPWLFDGCEMTGVSFQALLNPGLSQFEPYLFGIRWWFFSGRRRSFRPTLAMYETQDSDPSVSKQNIEDLDDFFPAGDFLKRITFGNN